jgi:polar amino acid transport system substrate-binding protein
LPRRALSPGFSALTFSKDFPMIKTLAAALALGTALVTATVAAADTVKVGISAEPYPPFYAPDASGAWSGWEIDFTKELCTRLSLECEITPVAWEGIIPALTTGKIDMIIGSMNITPERAKMIDFSDKYYNTPSALIGAKGVEMTPTAESLAGKYIGVQGATPQKDYAEAYFGESAAEVKEYQTLDEALQDLSAGRLDAIFADSMPLYDFLKTDAGMACCEAKGVAADDPAILGTGVGVGLRQGDPLREKINAAILAMREDGTYQAFSAKYFDFDVYGG